MESKHTPGKLRAIRNSAYWEVNPERAWGEYDAPYTVADCCPSDPGDTTGLQEANARRICATWNACIDIPTEALDSGVVSDMLEALQDVMANGIDSNNVTMIADVIAKAEGRA
jgi:hypothetical protein